MKKYHTSLSIILCLAVLITLSFFVSNWAPEAPTVRPVHQNEVVPGATQEQNVSVNSKEKTSHPAASEVVQKNSVPVVGNTITKENVFNGLNEERAKIGLKVLKRNVYLEGVAEKKLADMITYNYWAHDNPVTGKKYEEFFANEKGEREFYNVGEVLGRNFNTTPEMVSAWIASPTHYSVIRNEKNNFTEVGIAIKDNLVAVEFGSGLIIK